MTDIVAIVVQIVIAAISLFILYWVIRSAVLAALREHTKSTVTAVSLVTSNFHKRPEE